MQTDLIEWKSGFWKDQRVVEVYSRLMQENRGVTPLKNAVEQTRVAAGLIDGSVLDVGCGTGRASLFLARAGRQVTALDNSAAMLEQYRRLAGETPVILREGDLGQLDFAGQSFENVVSLNVLVHFPHWRQVLAEWQRVLRPGGRLVFDLHSQDHLDCVRTHFGEAAAGPVAAGEEASGYADYRHAVRTRELVEVANTLNMTVRAVLPYGAVISGAEHNRWRRRTLSDVHAWNRLLSWLPHDERLFECARFIEEDILGSLTSVASDHFMVVLENTPCADGQAAWCAHEAAVNRALEAGISLERLSVLLPDWNADWCERLNTLLDWPRNRVLFYFLWTAFWDHPHQLDLASFLAPRHAETLANWQRQWRLDQATSAVLRGFAAEPAFAATFAYHGVNLRPGLEYELTQDVLVHYFNALPA